MFTTFFIADSPRLFFKAGGAALQLGLVKTSSAPSTTKKFLGRSLGYPGPTWYLLGRFVLMNRFEDFSWEVRLRDPPAHMGCISLNGGFVAAQLWREVSWWSAEETTTEKAGPELCPSPAFLWTSYKKSFMGWCGESRWEPALFYFCTVLLVELILWKKIVSGFVCLCRPLRLAAWCQVPWVCKEAQPDMFSVQGPHPVTP